MSILVCVLMAGGGRGQREKERKERKDTKKISSPLYLLFFLNYVFVCCLTSVWDWIGGMFAQWLAIGVMVGVHVVRCLSGLEPSHKEHLQSTATQAVELPLQRLIFPPEALVLARGDLELSLQRRLSCESGLLAVQRSVSRGAYGAWMWGVV